jgi:hypothetical protein
VTVYVVDSAGQQSAGATSGTATTAPPPNPTVSVGNGPYRTGTGTGPCAGNSTCHDFTVSGANFTPGATITYTCSDGGVWWTSTKTWGGITVTADGSGNVNFQTTCLHKPDGAVVTISVSDGSKSASGSAAA